MDEQTKAQLFRRNEQIIEAVKKKAQIVCPGAVDLIAIAGSFANGDYWEKSDLDLLIVINSGEGWKIGTCFILGDVAHDIYCHTWECLEQMAEYRDPHVIKLVSVEMVYCASDAVRMRYEKLKEKMRKTLAKPLCSEDLPKIRAHYDQALQYFAKMSLAESFGPCKYASAGVLVELESVLYLLNKSYIAHGIKGIPSEICGLERLPELFEVRYQALIQADSMESAQRAARDLLRAVDALLKQVESELNFKQEATADALRGTYEEIFSNWRNKMNYAAKNQDRYLAFMSTASCQAMYDELQEAIDMPVHDLFAGFDGKDLDAAEVNFVCVMEEYRKLYQAAGLEVSRFDTVEEFAAWYLEETKS